MSLIRSGGLRPPKTPRPRGPLARALQRVDRGEDEVQTEIDEVDPGDGDGRLADEHHALVQQAIDELEERRIRRRQRLDAHSRPPKRYAGHGPARRTR